MALAWDPDAESAQPGARADTPLSVHSVDDLAGGESTVEVGGLWGRGGSGSRANTPPSQEFGGFGGAGGEGGPLDPLPLNLPDVIRSSGTAKGGAVSVAALPAYYQSTPPAEAHIAVDETFAAAEKLGRGPSLEERTGQEWFNSTGLLRMQVCLHSC
jgi:hypothetical protein